MTGITTSAHMIRNQIHTPPLPALLKIAPAPSHASIGLELNILILLESYAVTFRRTVAARDRLVYQFPRCLYQTLEVYLTHAEFHML